MDGNVERNHFADAHLYLRKMANTWFRFKQFIVHQQRSAMKVTTDACLFGALQPSFPNGGKGLRILDIGTGTGLLSLMMAQLNPKARITGVEIMEATAMEATENVAASPFKGQIEVIHADILHYTPPFLFDHILCNPPFHEDQLASPDPQKNTAHHATALQLSALMPLIARWVNPSGTASLLLPYYRESEATRIAFENGWFLKETIRVKQTPAHDFFRTILFFGKVPSALNEREITICGQGNDYTDAFKSLLQPFYLNL